MVAYGVRDKIEFHWNPMLSLTFWMTYRHIWNTWNLRVDNYFIGIVCVIIIVGTEI